MATEKLAGLNILILEDEYLIAMDVEHLCLEHGAAEVSIVSDLSAAGSPSDLPPFDVAVLDLMLNGHSTLGFAAQLRDRGVPFVFATGYASLDDQAADFLDIAIVSKPYSGIDLVEALVAALRKDATTA